jgi:hypothetical protein
VGNSKRNAAVCLGFLCALAASLALLRQGAGRRAGAGGPELEGVSAMRVSQGGAERLAVYRVVRGGRVVHARRPGAAGGPALRIDFELGGEHVTLWVKDGQPPPR